MQAKILQISKYVFAAISYLLLAAMLTLLVQQILAGFYKEDYGITEYLINYEGGFIRRGLIGTFLLWLYRQFGIAPYWLIFTICITSFIGVSILMLRFLKKQQLPLYLLGYCMFIGNTVYSSFWFRKDCLIICLFALIVFLVKQSRYWLAGVVFATAILIHEEAFFITLPLAVSLLIKNRTILQRSVLLVSGLVCFAAIVVFKGNDDISNIVWNSWAEVPFPYKDSQQVSPPSAIDGIGWTFMQGLRFNAQTWYNYDSHIWAPMAWLFILFFVFVSASNLQGLCSSYNYNRMEHTKLIQNTTVQLVSVLPLFLLGWDYGRWVFLALGSVYVLSVFDIVLFDIKHIQTFTEKCRKLFAKSFFQSFYTNALLLLLIGIPSYSWGLMIYRQSNAVQQIISFLKKLL